MNFVKLKKNNINEVVKLVVLALRQEKVVVLPTDTIYGFSCVLSSKDALDRLGMIKKREKKKPYIVLASDMNMVAELAIINEKLFSTEKAKNLYEEEPTTLVFKSRKKSIAKNLGDIGGGTIAIRLPKSDFLIKIISSLKEPITSTSFNLSGKPSITDLSLIEENYFSGLEPDLLVDAGSLSNNKVSRIIDISGDEIINIRD